MFINSLVENMGHSLNYNHIRTVPICTTVLSHLHGDERLGETKQGSQENTHDFTDVRGNEVANELMNEKGCQCKGRVQ